MNVLEHGMNLSLESLLKSNILHLSCTMLYTDFLPVVAKLFTRMINQGGSADIILKQVKKGIDRHPSSFEFPKTSAEIVRDIKLFPK